MERFLGAMSKTSLKPIAACDVIGVEVYGDDQTKARAVFVGSNGRKSKTVHLIGAVVSFIPSSIPTGAYVQGTKDSVLPAIDPLPPANSHSRFALSATSTLRTTVKFICTDPDGNVTDHLERINSLFEAAWITKFGGGVPLKLGHRFNQYDNSCLLTTTNLVTTDDKFTKYQQEFSAEIPRYKTEIEKLYASNKDVADFFTPVSRYTRMFLVSMCENPNVLQQLMLLLPSQTAISIFATMASKALGAAWLVPTNVRDVIIRFPKAFYGLDGKALTVGSMLALEHGQQPQSGYLSMLYAQYNLYKSELETTSASFNAPFMVIDDSKLIPVLIGFDSAVLSEPTEESNAAAAALLGTWTSNAKAIAGPAPRSALMPAPQQHDDGGINDDIEEAVRAAEAAAAGAQSEGNSRKRKAIDDGGQPSKKC